MTKFVLGVRPVVMTTSHWPWPPKFSNTERGPIYFQNDTYHPPGHGSFRTPTRGSPWKRVCLSRAADRLGSVLGNIYLPIRRKELTECTIVYISEAHSYHPTGHGSFRTSTIGSPWKRLCLSRSADRLGASVLGNIYIFAISSRKELSEMYKHMYNKPF